MTEFISKTIVLVDGELRIVGILAGRPEKEGDWEKVCKAAEEELDRAAEVLGRGEVKAHRRGGFQTLAAGFSYGGGQKKPCNFRNSKTRQKLVDELNGEQCFRRIAGFGSCSKV